MPYLAMSSSRLHNEPFMPWSCKNEQAGGQRSGRHTDQSHLGTKKIRHRSQPFEDITRIHLAKCTCRHLVAAPPWSERRLKLLVAPRRRQQRQRSQQQRRQQSQQQNHHRSACGAPASAPSLYPGRRRPRPWAGRPGRGCGPAGRGKARKAWESRHAWQGWGEAAGDAASLGCT